MDEEFLQEIVDQGLEEPNILGRLACGLKSDLVVQKHKDGSEWEVLWSNKGAYWRCFIWLARGSDFMAAQVDIHKDKTLHIEAWEPLSITVDFSEKVLCLTRYIKPKRPLKRKK